jgi:rhodanese-related sulfurtransferase
VDIRTRAEWAFVGIQDLGGLGREVLLMEWKRFPEGQAAPDSPARLAGTLEARGAEKNDQVFFIRRLGGRSWMAAEAMATARYRRRQNGAGGFEGPIDADCHRNQVAGWKFARLAWVRS